VKPERNLEAAKPHTERWTNPPAFIGSSQGTAACGPACTVVCRVGAIRLPYPDCAQRDRNDPSATPRNANVNT
jgi:hypothetical protein